MNNKRLFLILFILSFAIHFAFFGRPSQTVFDEVHFGKFVSGYYTGEYYFDIHPPLGKLAIAGFAKLFDFSAKGGPASGGQLQYDFTEIGKEFPDNKYLALRLLPAVAGALLPLVIYFLILELRMSHIAAFAGGLLVVFENALLTQSRFMLLDSFLLLFGFTALLFYFKFYSNRSQLYPQHSHILKNMRMLWDWNLFWMAIFAGLAVSIKWTGLSFVALPLLIEVYYKLKEKKVGDFLKFASFFFLSFVVYFLLFTFHFSLLNKPGLGDAFMSTDFRNENVFKKFYELNIEMYESNQRLTATHPYSSQWYTWPFMAKPIFYWIKDSARIYFLGNPVIWWASAIAVAIAVAQIVKRKTQKILIFLMSGYFLNLLPFIGVKRVMFLYHYLIPLVFAILILIHLLDKMKNAKRNFGILIAATVITFLFFAPLSYGLPLSQKAYEARVWLESWK